MELTNEIEIKMKMCKTCLEVKNYLKFPNGVGHNCQSCRNKKYYKKTYFKTYYEQNSEIIKNQALTRYNKLKISDSKKVGRPKKDEILV